MGHVARCNLLRSPVNRLKNHVKFHHDTFRSFSAKKNMKFLGLSRDLI